LRVSAQLDVGGGGSSKHLNAFTLFDIPLNKLEAKAFGKQPWMLKQKKCWKCSLGKRYSVLKGPLTVIQAQFLSSCYMMLAQPKSG